MRKEEKIKYQEQVKAEKEKVKKEAMAEKAREYRVAHSYASFLKGPLCRTAQTCESRSSIQSCSRQVNRPCDQVARRQQQKISSTSPASSEFPPLDDTTVRRECACPGRRLRLA
jgi:hypothetical protein